MSKGSRKSSVPPSYVTELLVQEYVSLRNESLSAKQNQQTILQWTLATVGIVVAAGIAAAAAFTNFDAVGRFGLNITSAMLTGVVMPVVVSCAFGIWLGELHRMERAGLFLRDREAAWSRGRATSADPSDPKYALVLLWESLLSDGSRNRRYTKNGLGVAAGIGLFVALSTFSLSAGTAIVVGPGGLLANLPDGLNPATVTWIVWAWVVVFIALNCLVFATPLYRLYKGSKPQHATQVYD